MNRATGLTATVHRASALSNLTRERMWSLFSEYYDDVTWEQFTADLLDKDHVIIVADPAERLQGFSTVKVRPVVVNGKRCVVVFSGDTVMARRHWGDQALQRAFLFYLGKLWLRHPWTPVYWFLISKGYRTYLLLSRNFREYWPRVDSPTPAWQAELLEHLGASWFPQAERARPGVLRFRGRTCRLKPAVAPVDERMLEIPDIRFFVERNPGHATGEELCCLGKVEPLSGLGFARKLVSRRVGRLVGHAPTSALASARATGGG